MTMTPTNNWNFVIAAYAITWLTLGGYWLFVHRAVGHARARYAAAVSAAAKSEGAAR
jgi:CcmD family protein